MSHQDSRGQLFPGCHLRKINSYAELLTNHMVSSFWITRIMLMVMQGMCKCTLHVGIATQVYYCQYWQVSLSKYLWILRSEAPTEGGSCAWLDSGAQLCSMCGPHCAVTDDSSLGCEPTILMWLWLFPRLIVGHPYIEEGCWTRVSCVSQHQCDTNWWQQCWLLLWLWTP